MRPILASLRIANAPSVISNVTLGFLLGGWYWGVWQDHDTPAIPGALVPLCLIGLLLLFAGNLLNDWQDREWDASRRPERALPSGRYQPRSYLIAGLLLLAGAVAIAATLHSAVLVITLLITAALLVYTRWHKRAQWPVLAMASCRAGLYGLGFLFFTPDPAALRELTAHSYGLAPHLLALDYGKPTAFILTHAAGLFAYIVGLSLNARYESLDQPPHGMVLISRILLLLPLGTHSAWWIPWYPKMGALALIPFALWTAFALTALRGNPKSFVSALLAGIPLIDLIATLPAAATVLTPGENFTDHPFALLGIAVPLGAFACARLLQRIAPAT